jgi:hypothetical protein
MDGVLMSFEARPSWPVVWTMVGLGVFLMLGGLAAYRRWHTPFVRPLAIVGSAVCFWIALAEFDVPPW